MDFQLLKKYCHVVTCHKIAVQLKSIRCVVLKNSQLNAISLKEKAERLMTLNCVVTCDSVTTKKGVVNEVNYT